MQGSTKHVPGDGKKGAAARLVQLRRATETPAEFARRLELSDQHISNYATGKYGLDLGVLARIAPKLSDNDILYIVAERRAETVAEAASQYADGAHDAVAALREALAAIEERIRAARLTVSTEAEGVQVVEAARRAKKGRRA